MSKCSICGSQRRLYGDKLTKYALPTRGPKFGE